MTRFRRRDAERRDDLVLLAAGMLEDRERDELLAHLDTGCPECAADLASAGATLEKLAAAIAPSPPPQHVKATLMARVQAHAREDGDAFARRPRADGVAAAEPAVRDELGAGDERAAARSTAPSSSQAGSASAASSGRPPRSLHDEELLALAVTAARAARGPEARRPSRVLPLLTAVAAAFVAAGMTWFGMHDEYDRVIGRLEADVSRLRSAGQPTASAAPARLVAPAQVARTEAASDLVEPSPRAPGASDVARPSPRAQGTPDLFESGSPSRDPDTADRVHELETELAAARRATTASDVRAEKAERELATLREDQTRLSTTNAGLIGDLAGLRAEAETLRATNAQLEKQVASLEGEAATRASDQKHDREQLHDRIDMLQAKLDQAGVIAAMLSSPAVDMVTLDAAKGAPDAASANVFWDYERNTCYLHATGLAPTTGDEVYALWLETDADRTYPMGSFQVGANGEGTLFAMLPVDDASFERATVTRESAAPGTVASGPPVLDARFGKTSSTPSSRRRPFYRGR